MTTGTLQSSFYRLDQVDRRLYIKKLMKSRRLSHPVIGHPTFVFVSLWTLALALASLQLVDAFSQHMNAAYTLCILVIGANICGAAVAMLMFPYRPQPAKDKPVYFRKIGPIFYLWAFISIVETIAARGLPIVWLLTGDSRTYEDFGLPTLHGFANAIWLFLCFAQFAEVADGKRRIRDMVLLALLTCWPILVVSRALFVILILQISFYLLITSRLKLIKVLPPALVIATIFFFAFGIVGDVRSPEFSIASALGFDQVDSTAIVFLWAYAYIVSPLANLALGVATLQPSYSVFPENTLSQLLPSIIKGFLGFEKKFEGYATLTHDAFNVGTAFFGVYYDWGVGGIILMAFIIGLVGHLVWRSARNSAKLPLLAAYCAFTALTIFTNQFTQLVPLIYMLFLVKLTSSNSQRDGLLR